ncbi:MAG: hypothetical protein AAF645_15175 [Myxococcota bacterium]
MAGCFGSATPSGADAPDATTMDAALRPPDSSRIPDVFDARVERNDTPEGCPTHMRIRLNGDGSLSSIGHTGLGHALRFNRDAEFSVALNCDLACDRCAFTGPVRNQGVSDTPNVDADEGIDNQRCLNDTRVACRSDAECEDIAANDAFNRNPPRCRFLYGAPLAVDTGGTAACSLLYFVPQRERDESPVEGTVDLRTGVTNFSRMHFRSTSNLVVVVDDDGVVSAAAGGLCSECVGDPQPNDGRAEGTCQVSERGDSAGERSPALGMPCDTNGFGTKFEGAYSFGCPATRSADSVDLDIENLTTAGRRWDPDTLLPMCTADDASDERCWCGVCSEDPSRPCEDDGDCEGTCGSFDPNQVPTVNNNCRTPCAWDPDLSRGTCEARSLRGVPLDDATVVLSDCFPSPSQGELIVPGFSERSEDTPTSEPFMVQVATLACSGPTGSPSANMTFGLPGPTLHVQRLQIQPEWR